MHHYAFDDRQINWQILPDIEHLAYAILDVDVANNIVDVLFKFSAHQRILLHRHLAQNNMLVLQGEHRLYDADGALTEIRPAGRYTPVAPSQVPHREGAGDQDAIVFFSIRSADPLFYEILNEQGEVMATLGRQDFINLYAAQRTSVGDARHI